MKISTQFTKEELKLLRRGLSFGIIHSDNTQEQNKFHKLDAKLNLVQSLVLAEESEKL